MVFHDVYHVVYLIVYHVWFTRLYQQVLSPKSRLGERGGDPPLNRYEKYKDSITKAGIENKNDTDVHVGSWQIGGAVR